MQTRDHKPAGWVADPERGSFLMLRIMTFLSLHLGRRASRAAIYGIAVYFFLFAPAARRSSRSYLRLVLGRRPEARDRFRQILNFATVIHDRFYLINERDDLFDISIEGADLMQAQADCGRGAFLMGAHLGSFEIMRTIGRHRPGLKVAMTMHDDAAHRVNRLFAALNPGAVPDIIPVGKIDSMLKISERLEQGAFVGMLGDRTLSDEPLQPVTLLGASAYLPTGPMRVAALLRCTVYFMVGLYRGKNRYHVVFAPLADFSTTPVRARAGAVHAAIDRYAALLDQYCRSDPYNWFNFFDFWREQERAPGA
jgi:predicted LPLAT superfamily acyltransferase